MHATHLTRGNAGMIVRGEQTWLEEENTEQGTAIKASLPIPIITLEPEVVANWSQMIAGVENVWTLGAVF